MGFDLLLRQQVKGKHDEHRTIYRNSINSKWGNTLMNTYTIVMNGWTENEVYTITAKDEGTAIQQAYKLADAPFSSLVEVEQQ